MSEELQTKAALLKFIPVVERCVEGLHRNVKVKAKHVKLGGPSVSLAVRLSEMKQLMVTEPSFLNILAAEFDRVRSPKKAVILMGFSGHPRVQKLLMERSTHSADWRSALIDIIYRCDLGLQFEDHAEQRRENEQATNVLVKRKLELNPAAPMGNLSYSGMLCQYAVDHMRRHVGSDKFATLPAIADDRADVAYQLTPLRQITHKSCRIDDGGDAAPPDEERREIVIKVLHGFPSRLKTAPMPIAAKKTFNKDSVIVTSHRQLGNSLEDAPLVSISSIDAKSMVMSGLSDCSEDTIRNIKIWSTHTRIMYTLPLPGIPVQDLKHLVSVVTDLVEHRTSSGSNSWMAVSAPAPEAPGCSQLQARVPGRCGLISFDIGPLVCWA
eukprot:9316469-Pyramimonas_sp.AAC.1